MRWTLVVSMDRKVFVAIVDSESHWAASCPKRGKSGGKDDSGKKGQGKQRQKCMMAKEKAKVASGKHAKHLMGTAITVGNGDTWTRNCFTKSKSKGGKGKSAGSLDESEKNGPENTSVGGFGLCSFRNHCDDWKWNNCREVTFHPGQWCGGVRSGEITGR